MMQVVPKWLAPAETKRPNRLEKIGKDRKRLEKINIAKDWI